jgi:hypothetical protein
VADEPAGDIVAACDGVAVVDVLQAPRTSTAAATHPAAHRLLRPDDRVCRSWFIASPLVGSLCYVGTYGLTNGPGYRVRRRR